MATSIDSVVSQFVSDLTRLIRQQVITEVHGMSLHQIIGLSQGDVGGHSGNGAPSKRGPGRPKKASKAAANKALETNHKSIVDTLRGTSGMRAEDLRKALGLDKREVVLALSYGLGAGTITKTGEKRATKYFVKRGT